MIVHQVERHFLTTVQEAVHCSVNANKLTMVGEISSDDLAAERIIRAVNRQEWAHGIMLVDVTATNDLLAKLVRAFD